MRLRPCQDSSALSSQLQDWFNTWWRRTPGSEEWKLLYELITEGPSDLVDQFTPNELQQLVRIWNKRLILSLSQETPRERVLCAFSCVEDTTYRLDQSELDEFVGSAAKELGTTIRQLVDMATERAGSGRNGRGGNLLDECFDLVDVLAALLYAWQPGRSGLRPALMDADLRAWVSGYIYARKSVRPDTVISLLGGAAGNMASVLCKLGLSVAIHWAYHAPDLTSLCPECLQRMTLDNGKMAFISSKKGFPDHPKRQSIVFSYAPGLGLTPNSGPEKIDRQIYRYPFNAKAGSRGWKDMIIQDRSGRRVPIKDPRDEVFHGEGWPFLPLFGEWHVKNTSIIFTEADDKAMKEVSEEFDYVILSGLNYLGDPLLNICSRRRDVNAPARNMVQKALQRQLRFLARNGVRLHLEVSGITRLKIAELVRQVMLGTVRSAGINQEELEGITGGKDFAGSPYFLAASTGSPEPFVMRYQRARRLAQAFDLDQLFVHGNDADLILVRGVPRGALWQELMADLFAKGIVVLALLEHSDPVNWQKTAAGLRIVLKKDGFLSLLALADEIARDKDGQDLLLRDIAFTGYWFNRNPTDYSVIIVPVMWPELPSGLTTTGAGDAASATLAVYGRT